MFYITGGLDKRAILLLSFYKGENMKKYFKYFLTGAFFALFLNLVLPSFAINFNEPRKVILPKQANAVYGSLLVRDKMILNYNQVEGVVSFKNDAFMVEIGQRPFYFWDEEKRHYRLQVQDLYLDKVKYNRADGVPLDNDNVYTFGYLQVPNGSFISEDIFFRTTGSSVSLRGSDAKLLLSFRNPLPADVYLGAGVSSFNVISHDLNFTDGIASPLGIMSNRIIPDRLTLRDYAVAVGGNLLVPFPSPRMIVFNNTGTSKYRAKGTATAFRLKPRPDTDVSHYYGPWNVVSNPNGIDISTTCPVDDENRCYKIIYGADIVEGNFSGEGGRSGINDPNSYTAIKDRDDLEFTCANQRVPANPRQGVYYNPDIDHNHTDTCFDYELVELPKDSSGNPKVYDSNSASYEFTVHEMFMVKGSTITLISQNPRFREKSVGSDSYDIHPISFSTTTSQTGWSVLPKTSSYDYFQINGQRIATGSTLYKRDDATYNDICFELCGGKLCSENMVYVKSIREGGAPADRTSGSQFEEPNPIVAPPLQGIDHTVVSYTYTVGFCPNNLNDEYTTKAYEINLKDEEKVNMVAGLLKKVGTSYKAPKVCVRRKVRCNTLEGMAYKGRNYRLLTVDH